MENSVIPWPWVITQVVSHLLLALSYAYIITRNSIQVRIYGGWLCFLCTGSVGLLVVGGSEYFSTLLDHMGFPLCKAHAWALVCNIGVFSCVHSIYIIVSAEWQLYSDGPPPHSSFSVPEELDRGNYTVDLVLKLEDHRTRFTNSRRREEDYRINAGELPPFRRAMGEDVDDPELDWYEDGDDEMGVSLEDDALPNPDFWSFTPPIVRPRTEYSRSSRGGSGGASQIDMRPRIRPENLYRRPVSVPGFPRQGLTKMRPTTPTTPRPQPDLREQASREGRTSAQRDRDSEERDGTVSPNTASNYPFYARYVRNRLFSPQLSVRVAASTRILPEPSPLMLAADRGSLTLDIGDDEVL
ncbi:hypothetical protein L873DRAFT_1819300 [Choiromyces venosus 120613-1]|uniref:Uncharacterized protein n=1 Tax=Choiromyces venosus 120613-1 TaxID=1336337 RepID=A0A3N4J4V6_9PEZI|nr:hypothetical protein L873DRAFT_1819300 [Choiromyces venosus 120613-1]